MIRCVLLSNVNSVPVVLFIRIHTLPDANDTSHSFAVSHSSLDFAGRRQWVALPSNKTDLVSPTSILFRCMTRICGFEEDSILIVLRREVTSLIRACVDPVSPVDPWGAD